MSKHMRGTFCYLPILRAKEGEFRAVGGLRPLARSRLLPMFDVPALPRHKHGLLEEHLTTCAQGIAESWGRQRPVFVDVHDLPRDLRVANGMEPILFVCANLRDRGATTIPVTGVEAERDKDYLIAVRDVARANGHGLCLRLFEEDFTELRVLPAAIEAVLTTTGLDPSSVDIVLDCRYVPAHNVLKLRNDLLQCIGALRSFGPFRNFVIAGGSEPKSHGKEFRGKVRRTTRSEFGIWEQTAVLLGRPDPIVFSDYAVMHPFPSDASGPVRPPARIRYTTEKESVSHHGKRDSYPRLCRQLVRTADFKGENFSRGDMELYRSAKGMAGPGSPVTWVGTDTNHHLELVSAQVWSALTSAKLAEGFALPSFTLEPQLQAEMDLSDETSEKDL